MIPQNLISLPDRLSGLANKSPQPTDEESSPSSDNSNLIDAFLKQFSSQIQKPFTNLSESYPSGQKEAEDVQNALAQWVNVVVSSINTGGPERPDNF